MTIDNPEWMTNPELHKEREAREIDQVLGWVFSNKNSLPKGITNEEAFQMSTSQKIELLRQLEQDPAVNEERRLDIQVLLKEVDQNKFEYE